MSERLALDADERERWRAYVRGASLLRDALNRALEAQSGMSLHEFEVLQLLAETPGGAMRMAALADCLVHSRSWLTHTVHRMEARGFVERRACESDGRGVYCVITPLGEETYHATEPGYTAAVRAYLLDRVTPEELEVLGRVMERIAAGLSGEDDSGGGAVPGGRPGRAHELTGARTMGKHLRDCAPCRPNPARPDH